MARGDRKPDFRQALERLASGRFGCSATELAELTGTSRQAAHRRLARMVAAGDLEVRGQARATRYHLRPAPARTLPPPPPLPVIVDDGRPPAFARTLATRGLEEDALWREVERALPALDAPEAADARATCTYAFTEMVNNAIDHSRASEVEVRAGCDQRRIWFEVDDRGVGAFENVRASLGLPDHLAALQEISKGKVSTMPERHSGEGLFFTSKMADAFELAANGLAWLVDNQRQDEAAGTSPSRQGTRVRFQIDSGKRQRPEEVFARYTHDFEFDTTRTVVRLFEHGVRFVSRSEAKRLVLKLERFRHVVVDFRGVEAVGQGFADEVFRVWSAAHPHIDLHAENMSAPVAFMIERARRHGR
jgi:anti-sigma regulatory factor (Ser/Thr protein kinase)